MSAHLHTPWVFEPAELFYIKSILYKIIFVDSVYFGSQPTIALSALQGVVKIFLKCTVSLS